MILWKHTTRVHTKCTSFFVHTSLIWKKQNKWKQILNDVLEIKGYNINIDMICV